MQKVQPIRELEAIDRMKRALKRDSLRNYFMFVLGLNTGMRISDILPLQVKDVRNKTHIRVKETKTRKSGTFRINRELWQDIADYTEDMQDEEYLFPSRKTNLPLTRVQAYRILRKAADKAGIEQIGTHSMRKTLGYHFYNQTKDVAVLQEIFNHSTPAITKDYIGITQKEIDDKMDNFYL
ncbi:site-specific integrase [Bacillus sp. FJAT-44742]|uniref:site-specific integrase n=1 Tax=Bacillus sp. FJAT-44742 TaxID=2014005 RepID=UPI000C24DC7D|nr:site-specific integrase [Bacillus sp. FJAT-44742]